MKLSEANLLPGDVCNTTDQSWIGKSIKWFENIWTGNATMTHSFIYIGAGNIVEALGSIKKNPITKYDNSQVIVYRVPLTDAERQALSAGMLSLIGGPYGFLKYPLFIADAGVTWLKSLFGNKNPCFFFSDTFGLPGDPVCSQLVVEGLYNFTSYRIKDAQGVIDEWKQFSPDYLNDELKLPVNHATVVFDSFPQQSLKAHLKDVFLGKAPMGAKRSGQWPTFRKHFLEGKVCAVCGGTNKLELHHLQPFHTDKSRELDPTNVLPLCEGNPAINCHLFFGHLESFKSWNINAVKDAALWAEKIKTRP
jgi:hypothetical protein